MDSENIYYIGTIYIIYAKIEYIPCIYVYDIYYKLFTNDIFYVYIMTNEEEAWNIKLYYNKQCVCMCVFMLLKKCNFNVYEM